jgi:hypothetical protein
MQTCFFSAGECERGDAPPAISTGKRDRQSRHCRSISSSRRQEVLSTASLEGGEAHVPCDAMRCRPASSVPANVKEVTHRPPFRQRRQTNRAVAVAQYHRAGGRRSSRQRRLKAEKLTKMSSSWMRTVSHSHAARNSERGHRWDDCNSNGSSSPLWVKRKG